MATTNRDRVGRAMDILALGLAPFVERQMDARVGASWRKMSDTNPRPMYFGVIKIDPQTDSRIYVPGVSLHISDDGGRTFRADGAEKIHVDHHAMWIDPNDTEHMIVGNDGGIAISWDGGGNYDFAAMLGIISNSPSCVG